MTPDAAPEMTLGLPDDVYRRLCAFGYGLDYAALAMTQGMTADSLRRAADRARAHLHRAAATAAITCKAKKP